jgi:hypothetical protein
LALPVAKAEFLPLWVDSPELRQRGGIELRGKRFVRNSESWTLVLSAARGFHSGCADGKLSKRYLRDEGQLARLSAAQITQYYGPSPEFDAEFPANKGGVIS